MLAWTFYFLFFGRTLFSILAEKGWCLHDYVLKMRNHLEAVQMTQLWTGMLKNDWWRIHRQKPSKNLARLLKRLNTEYGFRLVFSLLEIFLMQILLFMKRMGYCFLPGAVISSLLRLKAILCIQYYKWETEAQRVLAAFQDPTDKK